MTDAIPPNTRVRTGVMTRIENGIASYRVAVIMTQPDGAERTVYSEWNFSKARIEAHAKEIAAQLRQETKGSSYVSKELEPGDVIQLDPSKHDWGPMLCIVDEVKSWGVQCYWLQAEQRGKPPARCYYRAETGTFERVGRVAWHMVVRAPEDDG